MVPDAQNLHQVEAASVAAYGNLPSTSNIMIGCHGKHSDPWLYMWCDETS